VRFFGEREEVLAAREEARALAAEGAEASASPAGPVRHGRLAAVLVRAGALAQGIADAEREGAGADRAGPGERAAMAATCDAARALWASWLCGGAGPPLPPEALAELSRAPLPEVVRVRRAEGFALYGVYPETYAAAAQGLALRGVTVLGVRSIGTALAAMVAAGARSPEPPFTVRPEGHPFRRTVRLAPAFAHLLALRTGPLAVADEGPGLSGSSFLSAADALLALGCGADRIHLFPSHDGPPGPEAAPEAPARYAALARHVVPFEALFLRDGPLALARLAEDVVGEAEAAPEDLSAGAWRARLFGSAAAWPPTQGWRERRKYLLRAGGRSFLARFVGLGAAAGRALERARALAAARLGPAPAALRHGFLVERFEADAVPLPLADLPRSRVLAHVRRHLAFVASRFPAAPADGASPRALAEMARLNARLALGAGAEAEVDRLARAVPELERTARPVAVDAKLQPWEWLVLPGGAILKADALDHHADHGLVGCQDALWDVAGAAVELALSADETTSLAAAVRAAAPGAPPSCLPFYRAAYAAFEVGRWTLAASDPGLAPDEAQRRRREAGRLARALRAALAVGEVAAPAYRVRPDRPG
jgi:hypothetical protein